MFEKWDRKMAITRRFVGLITITLSFSITSAHVLAQQPGVALTSNIRGVVTGKAGVLKKMAWLKAGDSLQLHDNDSQLTFLFYPTCQLVTIAGKGELTLSSELQEIAIQNGLSVRAEESFGQCAAILEPSGPSAGGLQTRSAPTAQGSIEIERDAKLFVLGPGRDETIHVQVSPTNHSKAAEYTESQIVLSWPADDNLRPRPGKEFYLRIWTDKSWSARFLVRIVHPTAGMPKAYALPVTGD